MNKELEDKESKAIQILQQTKKYEQNVLKNIWADRGNEDKVTNIDKPMIRSSS